ncbi:lipocalin family protein [Niabella beijingensis]|uniref:lipocalin family protein n=1 Tax=Niabella beijingensis TaxID=2872700 RepID=UPI001CBF793D|nr:lipocalin family protein [Niabella beijingensis]MBZ4190648.1 lipocalin family protein [Niabella beijingensis]
MSRFVLFLLLCLPHSAMAQQQPAPFRYYVNAHGGLFGIDYLTLSSDHYYFFTASTENGCVLEKGTWSIKGNKLYMKSLDSLQAYPIPRLEFIKGDTAEFVTIKTFDYFHKPFSGLALWPLRRGDSTLSEFDWMAPDSLRQFRISKKEFAGFCFIYQMRGYNIPLPDTGIFHELTNDLKQINIFINWPEAGALDRGIRIISFGGEAVFTIKADGLYQGEERVYTLQKE